MHSDSTYKFTFFRKKKIFVKVLVIIISLFIIDITTYLLLGNITSGRIVKYESFSSGGTGYPSIRYPVVKFEAHNKTYKFNGNWDADYHYGDTVRVAYKPWRPKKAKIFTFWGVSKRPLVQCIISCVVWIMLYTSFNPPSKKKIKGKR